MTTDQKDYQLSYRRSMLGWAIPYGIANYKFDQCSQSLQVRLDGMKANIDGAKSANEQK